MSISLNQLIPAVIAYVTSRGGYVTKTKLLKLLYLIDLEYYRSHRSTLSEFNWRYLHLGPWAAEFDPLLETLRKNDVIQEAPSQRSDFDTRYLRAEGAPDLHRLFKTYADQGIIKNVLDIWGGMPTSDILDHVYFHTEPMEFGVRSESLDFSKVSPQSPIIYKRSSSGKSPSEIAAMRKAFNSRKISQPAQFAFRSPNYDDEFRLALEKLESGDI